METHTFGMRLPRDAAFKRFVHNADFIRHLLRAHPLPGLDEGQIAEMQPASANIVGPDLTQRPQIPSRQCENQHCWNAKPSRTPQCRSACSKLWRRCAST